MATCNPQTLLNQATGFQASEGVQRLMELALLSKIAAQLNPAVDVTPQGLLDSGKCFECLLDGQKEIAKLALLCDIRG